MSNLYFLLNAIPLPIQENFEIENLVVQHEAVCVSFLLEFLHKQDNLDDLLLYILLLTAIHIHIPCISTILFYDYQQQHLSALNRHFLLDATLSLIQDELLLNHFFQLQKPDYNTQDNHGVPIPYLLQLFSIHVHTLDIATTLLYGLQQLHHKVLHYHF